MTMKPVIAIFVHFEKWQLNYVRIYHSHRLNTLTTSLHVEESTYRLTECQNAKYAKKTSFRKACSSSHIKIYDHITKEYISYTKTTK